jgi:hypothetical protein
MRELRRDRRVGLLRFSFKLGVAEGKTSKHAVVARRAVESTFTNISLPRPTLPGRSAETGRCSAGSGKNSIALALRGFSHW